jgi:hypothetical protein
MQSCGVELAEDAVVPKLLGELMAHVAENMDAHARWVGAATAEAAAEQRALEQLARDYRSIAAAAARASETMRAMRTLSAAPHDPAGFDHAAFVRWMRKKIELQRAFAKLVLEHADASECALVEVAVQAGPLGARDL